MEKFHNLPLEKQNTIMDAAFLAFGTNGYKKTSVSDIAATAGISKAMVFHYFGTKKDLYLYLFHYCSNLVMNELTNNFDINITDFFDRIQMATNLKIAMMKKHPAMLSFLNSAYYENNEEIKDDIQLILSQGEAFRNRIALDGMDTSKFKDDVDVTLVLKMLVWIGEGFVSPTKGLKEEDLDKMCNEFNACIALLKSNLYKEQYL